MKNKLLNYFFSTKLGELYFDFLLWKDRRKDLNVKFLTPKEIVTITRNVSLVYKGVEQVKREVNKLINSKSSTEYDKVLKSVESMLSLADRDPNSTEAQFAEVLRSLKVKKGNKDIVTHTDHAKMIQERIEDYKQLQDHTVKRNLLRSIRKAKQVGDVKILSELEKEWKEKYGH